MTRPTQCQVLYQDKTSSIVTNWSCHHPCHEYSYLPQRYHTSARKFVTSKGVKNLNPLHRLIIQLWTRGRQIRTVLRSKTITVLPRRAAMIQMVGVILALFTVNNVTVNPTIPTSHHIMLHLFPPQVQCLLKALQCLLETYLPLQPPEQQH